MGKVCAYCKSDLVAPYTFFHVLLQIRQYKYDGYLQVQLFLDHLEVDICGDNNENGVYKSHSVGSY